MVDLPEPPKKLTVEAIYKRYEDTAGDWRRDHLGASIIGNECERSLWFTFRWCSKPSFDGRMLRLFETGFKEEARIIKSLRDTGVTIWSVDPDSGKQLYYSDFGGHFAGSLDAIGLGFLEAPKSYHVVEVKTSNNKGFAALQKHGIAATKPSHHSQVQMYMHWAGPDRTMYLVVCKETDEIYQERVYYDKEFATRLTSKAKRIIFANTPSFPICDSNDDFRCRFCDHQAVCRKERLPEVTCRTCSYSDAVDDGTWRCCKDGHTIESVDQRKICPGHIFIPDLVPLQQTDANPEKGWIMYGEITNGPGAIESPKLQAVIDGLVK